jgi:mono/diheme cytochrome c family protein
MKRSSIQLPTLLLVFGFWALIVPAAAPAGGDAAEGKKSYEVLCILCHGYTGAGDGPAGVALDPSPRNFTSGEYKFDADRDGVIGTDEDLYIVIRRGGAAFGGNPVMVPWMHLSNAEVANLIAYIRTFATHPTTRR